MSTDSPGGVPSDADRWPPPNRVELPPTYVPPPVAAEPPAPEPFDPYRFGAPDHPIDPAYAPPGYRPPVAAPAPPYGGYGQPPGGVQPGAFGSPPSYGASYGAPYGQPGGPNGGGYPYPGNPYQQTASNNGFAVTALVLGILSIVFCWASFIDLLLIIPAVVFSIIGISASKRRGRGKGMAIAGLACVIVGTLFATIFAVVVLRNLHCSNVDNGDGGTSMHCSISSNN